MSVKDIARSIYNYMLAGNRGFIQVLVGTLVGSIFSFAWSDQISSSEWALILAVIVLAIAIVFYVGTTHEDMRKLIRGMGVTVRYVEEVYRDDGNYGSVIFKEIADLISKAKSEILVVGSGALEMGKAQSLYRKSQAAYFKALYDIVKKHRNSGFRYIRIYQIRPSMGNFAESITTVSGKHCVDILELPDHSKGSTPKLDIEIRQIVNQRVSAFIIIDRERIIHQVDALTDERERYPLGFYFFEDRRGDLVQSYLDQFERLKSKSTLLRREEIIEAFRVSA